MALLIPSSSGNLKTACWSAGGPNFNKPSRSVCAWGSRQLDLPFFWTGSLFGKPSFQAFVTAVAFLQLV